MALTPFDIIAIQESAISDVVSYFDNFAKSFVKPKTSPGISGFIFDIPKRASVELKAEIADNFVEDNSFITDHRIKKPRTVTLDGLIGELVIKQEFFDFILQTIQTALSSIEAYAGDYTDGTTQIIRDVLSKTVTTSSRVRQIVDKVKNIVKGFDGEGSYLNLQQRAYKKLESLYASGEVMTVQTPWSYYDNMMIEAVRFVQDEETEEITDVSVDLKEIRFASTKLINIKDKLDLSRNDIQQEEKQNTGLKQGVRKSILIKIDDATANIIK